MAQLLDRPLHEWTRTDCHMWWHDVCQRNVTAETRAGYYDRAARYFAWLATTGRVPFDPMVSVARPPWISRTPRGRTRRRPTT